MTIAQSSNFKKVPSTHAVLNTITAVLLVMLATLTHAADQASIRVSLLLGDGASATALRVIDTLKQEPALASVEFRVFPRISPNLEARRFLQFSNLILVNTHDRDVVFDVAEDFQQAQARGGRALSVSDVFDPDIAALGLTQDRNLVEYFEYGGYANLLQMIRSALAAREFPGLAVLPPAPLPETAYYEVASKTLYTDFASYQAAYFENHPERAGRPWVGLYINRSSALEENDDVMPAIVAELEARGLNVLTGFGYPGHTEVGKLFLDENGDSRISVMVAQGFRLGNIPDQLAPVLADIDAPIINAITLYNMSLAEWEQSAVGLEQTERSWQLGGPELAGQIAPTVVGTKENVVDEQSGVMIVRSMPVPERIARLADRARNYVRLRELPAEEKRVAFIYYNYPPGRENIGASYLNVLAPSLWQMGSLLQGEGYVMDGFPLSEQALFDDIRTYGNNPPPESDEGPYVDMLVRSGQSILVSISDYQSWFAQVPVSLREQIVERWGEPDEQHYMVWRDPEGQDFFVFPGRLYGNVLFAAQPARGADENVEAAYQDITLPPNHQYLAFYLWLQNTFDAHAMVHIGTHATHEWLPGREAGFTVADPSEVMVGAVPQLYPYIVDNIGEGQQAKRRGMAAIITHMTPPIDKATMNPELSAVAGMVNDLQLARDRGSVAVDDMKREIAMKSEEIGLFTDLSITLAPGALLNDEQLDEIIHHVTHIGDHFAPFGLHTFGKAPDPLMQEKTAEAILSLEPDLTPEQFAARKTALVNNIQLAASNELNALSRGLRGRHIDAGPGNDPLRNPDVLPTGKNFYGFDPTRLPTTATWETGKALAEEMLGGYLKRHQDQYPDRLVFNLFATETNRHEGSLEAEILYLMGVKPVWNQRGRVQGVELISREELGRPRVDVTIVPSGLYRDLFPVLMLLLDQAVDLVKNADAEGNPLRLHVETMQAELEQQGIAPEQARRMASVRLFTEPTGAYGTGLSRVIPADESWQEEGQVADVYFRRVGHLFGQGYWGDAETNGDMLAPQLAETVFKSALAGAKAVIHSRSSSVYATLDNDDFYQYLGGTALAVRQIDGSTPETLVVDLSHPGGGDTITLERFMGEEMRARYLNPKWINAMLDEGYAGARFVRQVVDNLWGWQVTVPEAVDAAKWNEMYETYVVDRYELDIEEKFRAAENMGAYQKLLERMIVAIDKGYWDAPAGTLQYLQDTLDRVIPEVQADEARIAAEMLSIAPAVIPAATSVAALSKAAPSATPPTADNPANPAQASSAAPEQAIEGRVLEEQVSQPNEQGGSSLWEALAVYLSFAFFAAALLALGWWRQGKVTGGA